MRWSILLLACILFCICGSSSCLSLPTVVINSTANLLQSINVSSSPLLLFLEPGIYSTGTCGINLTAATSTKVVVTLQGMGKSPGDTVIVCNSTGIVTVGLGFTLSLRNLYLFRNYAPAAAPPMVSVSVGGTLIAENVTFGGRVSSTSSASGGQRRATILKSGVIAMSQSSAALLLPATAVAATNSSYYSFKRSTSAMNTITFTDDTVADVLVVGGGGSGASRYGGGGGAGALVYLQGYKFSAGTYLVNVGAGGASVAAAQGSLWGVNGKPGGDSFIARDGIDILRAKGGGGGTTCTAAASSCLPGMAGGSSGGSGGSSSRSSPPVPDNAPVGYYGNSGGSGIAGTSGGGGGGAGSGGWDAGGSSGGSSGGSCVMLSITGTSVAYAAGGGGGAAAAASAAAGGGGSCSSVTAGGAGSVGAVAAAAGAANTGSGGGGSGFNGTQNAASGAGADGIVIIRFLKDETVSTDCSSGAVECAGGTCQFVGTTTFESIPACGTSGRSNAIHVRNAGAVLQMSGDLNLWNVASSLPAIYLNLAAAGATTLSIRNLVARGNVNGVLMVQGSAAAAAASASHLVNLSVSNSTLLQGNIALSATYCHGIASASLTSSQGFWAEFGGTSVQILSNYFACTLFNAANLAAHPRGLPQISMRPTSVLEVAHNYVGTHAVAMAQNATFAIDTPAAVDVRFYNNTMYSSIGTYRVVHASGMGGRLAWNIAGSLTFLDNWFASSTGGYQVSASMNDAWSQSSIRVGRRLWMQPRRNPATASLQRSLYVEGTNGMGSFVGRFRDVACISAAGCMQIDMGGTSAAAVSSAQIHIEGAINISGMAGAVAFKLDQSNAAAAATAQRALLNISSPSCTFEGNFHAFVETGGYSQLLARCSVTSLSNNTMPSVTNGGALSAPLIAARGYSSVAWTGSTMVVGNNTFEAGWAILSVGSKYATMQIRIDSIQVVGNVYPISKPQAVFLDNQGYLQLDAVNLIFQRNSAPDTTNYMWTSLTLPALFFRVRVTNLLLAEAADQPTTSGSSSSNRLLHLLNLDANVASTVVDVSLNHLSCIGLLRCIYVTANAGGLATVAVNGSLLVSRHSRESAIQAHQSSSAGPRAQIFIRGTYNFSQNAFTLVQANMNADVVFDRNSSGVVADSALQTIYYFREIHATSALVFLGRDFVFQRSNTHLANTFVFDFLAGSSSSSTSSGSAFSLSGTVLAETSPTLAATFLRVAAGARGSFALGGNHFVARGFQTVMTLSGARLLSGRATFSGYFEISNRPMPSSSSNAAAAMVLSFPPRLNSSSGGNDVLQLDGFYNFSGNANSAIARLVSNATLHLAGAGGIVEKNSAAALGLFEVVSSSFGGSGSSSSNNLLLFGGSETAFAAATALPPFSLPPPGSSLPQLLRTASAFPAVVSSSSSSSNRSRAAVHTFRFNSASYLAAAVFGSSSSSSSCPANNSLNNDAVIVFNASFCVLNHSAAVPALQAAVLLQSPCLQNLTTMMNDTKKNMRCSFLPWLAPLPPCPAASFRDVQGSGMCLMCPQGRFYSAAAAACNACLAGTFSRDVGSLQCLRCPAGTFAPQNASSTCLTCTGKMYQPSMGASACLSCPSGYVATTTL